MKRKILHVIDSLKLGGAEILLKNTISWLPEFHHIVVCLVEENDLKKDFDEKTTFYILNHSKEIHFIPSIFRLRKIIRKENPAIVHSHLQRSNLISRFAIPSKIPLITSIHSIYSQDAFKKNKKALLLEKLSLRFPQTIIAVSNEALRDYVDSVSFKGKTLVLNNFVPDVFFQNRHIRNHSNNKLRCIAVGNLKKVKNYSYLMKAFDELKFEEISLDIFGMGELETELRSRIEKNKLPIRLCGVNEALYKILPDYDLFIQASEHEGFSMTVMEAMAMGVPLLISDISVFHEVTEDNAHFFSLEDISSFIEKIKVLKLDIVLRYKHSDNGIKVAMEKASKNRYIENLANLYNKLMN